jgi:hypothetical protein
MLFAVAEKLILAAGTYPCEWTYRDDVVSGDLRLEGSQGLVGEMSGAPGTWVAETTGSKSFEPHDDGVNVLPGRLRSGHRTVLVDARVQHLLPERSWVQGQMALVGLRLPEELLFDSVRFQVGGLTELAGVYPIKSVTLPESLGTDAVTGVTWNAETATQAWTTSDGDDLELEFTANINYGKWYSFSLTSAPVITVSGRPRSAGDWMRQYIRPLAEITTLATLRSQSISWATLYYQARREFPVQLPASEVPQDETMEVPVQVFAADIAQQPYDASPAEISNLISLGDGTLIRLGPDGAALPALLAGWRSLQTTYVTFFDYLTAALRANMSPKSRFLALVPALEGFHQAKYGDGPIPRKEFKEQRKDVLRRITELDGVDSGDVNFLNKWLSVYGSYQLADRLRMIVDHELSEGLRERLQARVDPFPETLSGLVEQPEDVWAVVGTARNRIAHGSGKQPTAAHLATLTRLAHTVAIGAALNVLGIPDTVICASIDQGRWPVI